MLKMLLVLIENSKTKNRRRRLKWRTISREKLQNKLRKIDLIKTIPFRVQHKAKRIRGSKESNYSSLLSRQMNRKLSQILFQLKNKQKKSVRKRRKKKRRQQKKLRVALNQL